MQDASSCTLCSSRAPETDGGKEVPLGCWKGFHSNMEGNAAATVLVFYINHLRHQVTRLAVQGSSILCFACKSQLFARLFGAYHHDTVVLTWRLGLLAQAGWQRTLHDLPNHIFDASSPARRITPGQRVGGLLTKVVELSAVGTVAGAAMSGLGQVRLFERCCPILHVFRADMPPGHACAVMLGTGTHHPCAAVLPVSGEPLTQGGGRHSKCDLVLTDQQRRMCGEAQLTLDV